MSRTVGFETEQEPYANGGTIVFPDGSRYDGKWYECLAIGEHGNNYRLLWTNVNWDAEDESDRCNWDSPDYILNAPIR